MQKIKEQKGEQTIAYLKQLCEDDFFRNDRELIGIVKKLTKQTASLGQKGLAAAKILQEAEQMKKQMQEKEAAIGLSEEQKPRGKSSLENIENTTMYYERRGEVSFLIERFIGLLKTFFSENDAQKRKEKLIEAKALSQLLQDKGIPVKSLILNRERQKMWYLLDNEYGNTLKKIDIDLFIEKIHFTRLQYQADFDEMHHFQEERQEAIRKIIKAREKGDSEEVEKLQTFIDTGMDVELKPLLIDTHKILDSLDIMLDEIPDELDTEQKEELKEFMPALSEYFEDQCYRISGGYAYTPLAKHLAVFQEVVDEDAPVAILLEKADTLEYTVQHLYILHWIAESMLKKILHNLKSMGPNMDLYAKKFSTKTSLEKIRRAVKVRNNIAHNGLLWIPDEIKESIKSYRNYIPQIAKEQNIDLSSYVLPRYHRKINDADRKRYTDDFFDNILNIERKVCEEADSEYTKKLVEEIERKHWYLPDKRIDEVKRKIKRAQHDHFAQEEFGYTFIELREKLVEYESKHNKKFNKNKKEDIDRLMAPFFNLRYNNNPKKIEHDRKWIKQRLKKGWFSWK